MLELPGMVTPREDVPLQRTGEAKTCSVTGAGRQQCEHCSARAQRWRRHSASTNDQGEDNASAAHFIAGIIAGLGPCSIAGRHSALHATAGHSGGSDEFARPAASATIGPRGRLSAKTSGPSSSPRSSWPSILHG